MNRGLVLIALAVVLLAATVIALYFANQGQLWCVNLKYRYVLIPDLERHTGLSLDQAIADLNPQLDRLIARRVLTWYSRRISGTFTWEQRDEFKKRVRREIVVPKSCDIFVDARREKTLTEARVHVVLLVNETEHKKIDAIVREAFGSLGEIVPPDDY